jgi:hypothetical protein
VNRSAADRTLPAPQATADLILIELGSGYRMSPQTVHGLLWLQTHFEACHWDGLARGESRLSRTTADHLQGDAEAAGVRIVLVGDPLQV